ncbi:MAG: tetratricopeptide repeat protein [bacterium]
MKIKPLYIYLIAIVILIIVVIMISTDTTTKETNSNQMQINKEDVTQNQMPADEIHKGMKGNGSTSPSKDNVNKEAVHQFEMLKKAYESNPNDTIKAKAYAEMLAAGHKPEEAVKIFENILAKDNKRVDILLLLTMVSYNMQNYDKAESYTLKIIAVDKNNMEARYNLGAIAASKGDNEKAKKIWQDIVKKYPKSQAATYSQSALDNLK